MAMNYRILPAIAAVTWGATLTGMLVHWIYIGRPKYPTQKSPYIPFMSDIGAFAFQPYYIAGSLVAGTCFFVALIRVHSLWQRERQSEDTRWPLLETPCSVVAIACGAVGSAGWILQAIYDGVKYHGLHIKLVYANCLGVYFSIALTSFMYHEMHASWTDKQGIVRRRGVRKNRDVVVLDAILGLICVLLTSFMLLFLYARDAGTMRALVEWSTSYLVAPLMWLIRIYLLDTTAVPASGRGPVNSKKAA